MDRQSVNLFLYIEVVQKKQKFFCNSAKRQKSHKELRLLLHCVTMKRKEIEELLTMQWIYYSIPCIVKIETLSKKQRMNKRSIYMEKKTIRQTGLEVIRRLENEEELQAFSEFQQKLRYFKKRFEDEEFRIAVVGEFSSGKSTFINALIGQDVLQHAKKETTATITRLVNVSPQDTRCGKGNVKLHSGEIVALNDFTSLKEYTTTASDKLDVAAEVEQAELFVPLMKSTRPMVVVDTPGLNGIEGGHREQTMALVQQAHACIYLISRRGISESDTLLLRQLAAIQKNFIFIQNFIDDLNAAEGETLLQKLDEQKRILQEKVLYDAPDVKFSLCGISALLALAAQDQSIDRLYAGVNEPKLTEEMRRQMYQRSNFQQ